MSRLAGGGRAARHRTFDALAAGDTMAGLALMVAIAERHPQESAAQVMHRFARMGTIDLRIDFLRQGIGKHFDADGTVQLALDGAVFRFREASPYPARDAAQDPRRARAPVAGVVAHVSVAVGQAVQAGQPLVCVEAMKMEMWLNAAAAGKVVAVHAVPKASVAAGAVLVELEIAQ